MPLNASGAISLAGATAGQSIAVELGQSATAQISLNDAAVRSLAGVASGAITMPTNFYGKSVGPTTGVFLGGPGNTSRSLRVTRINASGALIGSETVLCGFGLDSLAGAPVGSNALYYGGRDACGATPNMRRVNACGTQVGTRTFATISRFGLGGARVGTNGLFYGGNACSSSVTRINACQVVVGAATTVGTGRVNLAGAPVGSNGLFYGGGTSPSNIVTRINACGALVGSQTTVNAACCVGRSSMGAATVGVNGFFYGGLRPFSTAQNTIIRINACGAKVGGCVSVGTARTALSGAPVGSNGLYYGGITSVAQNVVTRINACAALVGTETNVGTARCSMGSASI